MIDLLAGLVLAAAAPAPAPPPPPPPPVTRKVPFKPTCWVETKLGHLVVCRGPNGKRMLMV